MGCFSCFGSAREDELKHRGAKGGGNGGGGRAAASSSAAAGGGAGRKEEGATALPRAEKVLAGGDKARAKGNVGSKKDLSVLKDAQTFTFRQLAAATRNFRLECFIGEGGFGRVYKGRLDGTGQVVAIKQLNRDGNQGNKEFLVEVLMLSLLHHENLVNLVGYCADGEQRLLVYEYMPLGSLEDHLHDLPPDKQPLDWNTRMKIAAGAARGLEYLHDKAQPPVIYRDFKSLNILLGEGFHPKLSDFGLAKLGPVGDKSHVSTRVMGTYGYCAPEYAMTGQLTAKSDVYSFGVVLLELITGRKAIDSTRPTAEQNLVPWARPLFNDRRKLAKMADPGLQGRFPTRGLYQALAVASMCIQSEAASRPLIADVVTALSYLANQIYDPNTANTSRKAGDGDQRSRVSDSGRAPSKNDDAGSSGHKSHSSSVNCVPGLGSVYVQCSVLFCQRKGFGRLSHLRSKCAGFKSISSCCKFDDSALCLSQRMEHGFCNQSESLGFDWLIPRLVKSMSILYQTGCVCRDPKKRSNKVPLVHIFFGCVDCSFCLC